MFNRVMTLLPTPAQANPVSGFLQRWRLVILAMALMGMGMSFSASISAQIIPGLPNLTEKQPEESWQAPEIRNLELDWWLKFDTEGPQLRQERIEIFLAAVEEQVRGMDSAQQAQAEVGLENLQSLLELLRFTTGEPEDNPFEPVPTLDVYTLDELLQLRSMQRRLTTEQRQLTLDIETMQQQTEVLKNRREQLWVRYRATSIESPFRIQAGIALISLRVELALTEAGESRIEQRMDALDERQLRVQEQFNYALENLQAGSTSLDDVNRGIESAEAELIDASQQVTTLQAELLKVLSATPRKPSLVMLREQQLTRASVVQSLRELQLALASTRADWYRLQAGVLDLGYDFRGKASQARERSDQALSEVGVWAARTQTTLIAQVPEDGANARANHEIALSVARETLDFIDQIRATSDDLLLTQEILAGDLVSAQSGLRKAWSSLRLGLGSSLDTMVSVADYRLFSISDTPVTPGGIVVMILIVMLAWGISWLIRYLITHTSGKGDRFSHSPVAYTLGRILHYLIMTVGLFAAFTSIGFDFTSFALIAGALSVGIGFGLQAVVNNFVSGLILLLEGSLRVGDYIELGGARNLAGMVKEINTRATVVNTNDNVDVVVPNSELVTTRLTNWTLRESIARMRIPFGVAYGSDKEAVREAALEATSRVEFALTHMPERSPQVRLYNFGDNALEFEMLLWVSRAGVRRPHRVRCEFLWHLETCLTEAGIEIPFPQRDLHLRSGFAGAEGAMETGLIVSDE